MKHAGLQIAGGLEPQAGNVASPWPFGNWEDVALRGFVLVVAIALAWYSWARWGDIQVDLGREVYVPVEILKGRMLYRDLWYPYGPLVPYVQALLLWCFGVHLNTFYCFGIFLTLSITFLSYSLARRFIPPIGAAVVSIVCLRQGFWEFLFNYVFPYSYSAVVGLTLVLVCIYFLFQYVDTRSDCRLVLASLAAGLALLCKQEFGAAAMLAIGFVMVWDLVANRSLMGLFHQIFMIAPSILLVALVYGWFFWRLTPDFMLRENFALSPRSPFMKTVGQGYIARGGFRFVPTELATTFAKIVLSLAIWFLAAQFFVVAVRKRWMLALSSLGLILVLIGWASPHWWAHLPYRVCRLAAWPIGMYWVAPAILIAAIAGLPRGLDQPTRCSIGLLAAFGMALALRVFVVVPMGGYSIYYDPPLFILFMIAVTALLGFGARHLVPTDRLHLINCFLAMDAVWLLLVPFPGHVSKAARVETPIGTIFGEPAEAVLVPQIVSFLRVQAAEGKRVLILPEFPMLYVMGGMDAPSRWYELVPGMLDTVDERQFISDAESQDVEYVIITNRRTPEYGYPYFGIDWGQDIYRWVNTNFVQSGEFGRFARTIDAPFAALIFKRRTLPGAN